MTEKEFKQTMNDIINQGRAERAAYESASAIFYRHVARDGTDDMFDNFTYSANLINNIRILADAVNDRCLIKNFCLYEDFGEESDDTVESLWEKVDRANTGKRQLRVILHHGFGEFRIPEGFDEEENLIFNLESARRNRFLIKYVKEHREECKDLYVAEVDTTSDSYEIIKCEDHEILVYVYENRIYTVDTDDFKKPETYPYDFLF